MWSGQGPHHSPEMMLNHFTGEQEKKNILENGNSLEEKKTDTG